MDVLGILRQKSLEYGIPYEIVYSIVGAETGGTFDPATVGDNGNSFGLFQINKPSHPDFDTSRYTDVRYQADYQLPELVEYYKKGYNKGLRGSDLAKYVEVYGQRPNYSDPNVKKYIDSAIPKYYNNVSFSDEHSIISNVYEFFQNSIINIKYYFVYFIILSIFIFVFYQMLQ